MFDPIFRRLTQLKDSPSLHRQLLGPPVLAFLPAATLAAYWLGGERALLLAALVLPLLYAVSSLLARDLGGQIDGHETLSNVNLRDRLIQVLDDAVNENHDGQRTSVCFAIEIDEFKSLEERYGRKSGEDILAATAERIADSLRDYDVIAR